MREFKHQIIALCPVVKIILPRITSIMFPLISLCVCVCTCVCVESDEGDSPVFRVTPDFGLLRPKERHVTKCSQCLQISFTPRYRRRHCGNVTRGLC